tara:strand:+ start:302 stop:478 length:177 start_codon:yes stop_codon:yes gene_type:complete
MIKIFTSSSDANNAGRVLQEKFDKWKTDMEPNGVEILDVNSNSNQYGWMMIITYKIIR